MTLHKEIELENDIFNHLAAHGWLHEENAHLYDTPRALFPSDLIAWVQATQPKAWDALTKSHGAAAEATLLDRLRKQLDERGTLDVLRFGIDMIGVRETLKLAQFKPALAMNPELQARYAFAANTTMSTQALDSERVRNGLKDILLGPAQLYEALRFKGGNSGVGARG